ncbi:7734_t:CDS:2 [Paraglomus occultum]|uniref:chitin synthase n=1 Tax=Paraglomus occultum TaxID=144539 RepID=A0A9N9FQX2_9GLOM|nr:7734_t:CDS:2 [Paraglomus occultum]
MEDKPQSSDLPIYSYYRSQTPSESSVASYYNSTEIFNAIIQNNVGRFRSLLEESNIEINLLRDENGMSPLMVAASKNCPTVVRYLMTLENLDIDLKDNDGESALFQAASSGNVEIAEILIGSGALVDSENKGERSTPLIVAASKGYAGVCRLLLDHGRANVNHQNSAQRTALALAAYGGHYAVVEILLSRGADVNIIDQEGWTALMLAAFGGWPEICYLLLENNADKHISTKNGKNAVSVALDAGRKEAALLINDYVPEQPLSPLSPQSPCSPAVPPQSAFMPPVSPTSPRFRRYSRQTQFLASNVRALTLQKTKSDVYRPPSPKAEATAAEATEAATEAAAEAAATNARRIAIRPKIPREPKRRKPGQDPNSPWVIFSLVVTSCICNSCLLSVGKMSNPKVRQAWREKVALVFLILVASMISAFLSFALTPIACNDKKTVHQSDVVRLFGPNSPGTKAHIVRGQLFNTGTYFSNERHRPIAPFTDADLNSTITPLFGHDISGFFPLDYKSIGCSRAPVNDGSICTQAAAAGNTKLHCHVSQTSRNELESLSMKVFVGFNWDDVTEGDRDLFAFNGDVYDVTDYLNSTNTNHWLGDDAVTEWIRDLVGRDATMDIARENTNLAKCLQHFRVGVIDDGTSASCFIASAILRMVTILFLGATSIKFAFASLFDWYLAKKLSIKPDINVANNHIMMLVTCYSEGETSIRSTLDSLANTTYPNDHKLLFLIADGDITGSENDRSTPQICKDLLEPQFPGAPEPEPLSYIATGDDIKQHNMAQVYTGYYNAGGNRVPMVLIIKCGTPEERQGPKPGNRGKRDSQLILMRWLRHICFNDDMCPLEYELFERVHKLTGVTPDKYEMILMVDADTVVKPDSASHLVAAMESDPTILGMSGETKVANKTESWVTMIQVFEYYISHHLGKSFESVFGGVTCLPGCFCMYRIKAPKSDGYFVPILANPDIVDAYASNDLESLHRKNLLILGEDRFLTTLMLQTFPKRKIIYEPKAICKTVVPDKFSVLLSQRRRWINSTIHSLMELVITPYLCGFACCSMQFFLLLDLFGSAVTPFSVLVALYLIIVGVLGQNVSAQLEFLGVVLLLPSLLLVVSSRKASNILWMMAYILAFPIWNFVLPVYAYWHFDDFSWGATRKISGVDNGHGDGDTEKIEAKPVPMKKWHEWKMQEKTRTLLKHYSGFVSTKAASMPKKAPSPGIAKSNSLRTLRRNKDNDDNNNTRRATRSTLC